MSLDTRNKLAARRRKKFDAGEGGGGGEEEPSESPRVLILGPPGAGKTTLAAAMAAKYGSVLVSVDAEAKAAADAGSEKGRATTSEGKARVRGVVRMMGALETDGGFYFQARHMPGVENSIADGITRW